MQKSVSDEKIIEHFNNLGLAKYEAKVYLTLLRNNLSYGSEIQKISGVPGPKIYEVLAALVEKGIIYPAGNNPTRYQPLPLGDYINTKQKEFDRVTGFLNKNKDKICKGKIPDYLWQLQGYENLLDKARELIDLAKKQIIMSFWQAEGKAVERNLEEAHKKGVEIISIQMGEGKVSLGKNFKHVMLPVVYEMHSTEFLLVIDASQGMFMVKNQLGETEGYYTSNKGILQIVKNYIRHDIYINRVISDFGEVLSAKYGANLEKLLNV